jgi:glycosyltransferase involved in cell wall biosynthesis
MKIGLFLPNATFDLPGTSEVGGIEVYALELGEQLQKRGHDVVLFGGNPKAGRQHRAIPFPHQLFDYIETKDIPKLGTRFRKLVQRLHFGSVSMKALAEAKFETVFIFKPYDFINAWRWKSFQKDLKVVMNYQGTDFFPTDRFWHRWIDREYAVSPENARLAEARYGGSVTVIPNGVDTNFFHSQMRNDQDNVHVLTAGRLVGWKGLRVLAEAIAEVPGVSWHVAGDGPELPWLKSHAAARKYDHRVVWYGAMKPDALAMLMRTHAFFAQPSIGFDACPTAVLQAMSSGMIVAMSDKVGLHESFTTEREFLFVPGGKDAWIAALEKMKALTPDQKIAISTASREAVVRSFSWSGICTQIEALIQTP